MADSGSGLGLGTEPREESGGRSFERRLRSRVRRRPAERGIWRDKSSNLGHSAVALTMLRGDLL